MGRLLPDRARDSGVTVVGWFADRQRLGARHGKADIDQTAVLAP